MLTQLSIQNYTLVEHLDLEFDTGMTVITGETGAGKSIMLDALGLTLGDRAGTKTVRPGAPRADIHACFDISNIPQAKQWLSKRDLAIGDDCLLRRTISSEGRSRGYINSQPCTLQDLKTLGEMLIDIHSQHEHQSLLDKTSHNRLLDEFAGHQELVQQVQAGFHEWKNTHKELVELESNHETANAQQQLLHYQVQELDELGLAEGELIELEAEQKTLANAEQILQSGQQAVCLCDQNDGSIIAQLNQAIHQLNDLPSARDKQAPDKQSQDKPASNKVEEALQLLKSAEIQVSEAKLELETYLEGVELNPQRLLEVESRLSKAYDIARKHHVSPAQLHLTHETLAAELNNLQHGDARLEELQQQLTQLREQYQEHADKLSKSRQKAAKRFIRQVQKQLQNLGMTHCRFDINLPSPNHKSSTATPNALGNEQGEFLISTNPGSEPAALHSIASGGELSRISLAIQVVTAATSQTPTLVFDEVDVGIGGATAEVIGNLLRQLGDQGQVICVTHLAQVAAKGHHHLTVSKKTTKTRATTRLALLDDKQKIEEIARMLGGIAITDQSMAHAEEMLRH